MRNIPNQNPAAGSDDFSTITSFLRTYLSKHLATMQPVKVIKVYEDNGFVDVAPLVEQINTSGEVLSISEQDTIYNIPIVQHFGNNCQVTILPAVGDVGFLLASKYDISGYKKNKAETKIGSFRQFDWSDGVFFPLTFNHVGAGVIIRNNKTVINVLDGSINITGDNLTVNAKNATINATEKAVVNSPAVELGGEGGQGVARLGDAVQVVVAGGSSAGTWPGTIVAASSVVKAV